MVQQGAHRERPIADPLPVSAATDDILTSATNGCTAWSGLPAVFTSDALQPALAPLMDPAVQKARQIQSAADEFLQVATRAANSIEDLQHDHDALVRQIEQFHSSAPGQVAAEASRQAAKGDLLGAVGTVIENWQQVPALVTEEVSLRVRIQAHNDNVTSTMNAIAAQLDAITPSAVDAHPVHTAAHVSGKNAGGDPATGSRTRGTPRRPSSVSVARSSALKPKRCGHTCKTLRRQPATSSPPSATR